MTEMRVSLKYCEPKTCIIMVHIYIKALPFSEPPLELLVAGDLRSLLAGLILATGELVSSTSIMGVILLMLLGYHPGISLSTLSLRCLCIERGGGMRL